jgi:ribosome-associated protein
MQIEQAERVCLKKGYNMSEQGVTSITIAIRDEYIELYKLLKLANLADSGGQAKYMISEGMVQMNGESEPETRKRRKTRVNETVQCSGVEIQVIAG